MEMENYFKKYNDALKSLPSRLSNTKQIFPPALKKKKKLSHTSDAEKNKYLLLSVIIFLF